MGKKNKNKTPYVGPSKTGSSKTPSFLRPDRASAEVKVNFGKRQKTGDKEIDMKSKVTITDDMFEAARRMKGGVAHIN
jgi:hypothetical protein